MKLHNKLLGISLSVSVLAGSAACSTFEQPSEAVHQPRPTVTSTPPKHGTHSPEDVSPSPDDATASASPILKIHKQAGKMVVGESAYYQGFTKKEVRQIEHCGNTSGKVLFTFDDSGSPQHVAKIQKYLADQKIGAIFFPHKSEFSDARSKQLRKNKFWVGSHSRDHKDLHALYTEGNAAEVRRQIQEGPKSDLFRPPYGGTYADSKGRAVFDTRIYNEAAKQGYRICNWTVDSLDWKGEPAEVVRQRVSGRVQRGSVILFHMLDHSNALGALPGIVKDIKAMNLEICELPSKPTTTHVPDELPC